LTINIIINSINIYYVTTFRIMVIASRAHISAQAKFKQKKTQPRLSF